MYKLLPLLLCVAIVGSASAQEKTKGLLNDLGIAHAELDGGLFKVVVSNDTGTTTMLVKENSILGSANEHLQVVTTYAQVVSAPEGFSPPLAMLRKIDELNGNSNSGRLFTNDGSVWITSEQALRLVDAQSLSIQLELMTIVRAAYEEVLAPFVEEE